MGGDLQADLVEGNEAERYSLKRVACESCLSEGATRGMETDEGSTLLCETCAVPAGGIQYERYDDALLPNGREGPVASAALLHQRLSRPTPRRVL